VSPFRERFTNTLHASLSCFRLRVPHGISRDFRLGCDASCLSVRGVSPGDAFTGWFNMRVTSM
jgi:hypothetical protein